MLWQGDSPMRTGDASGWYTAAFSSPGNPMLDNVRVYVVNLESGRHCDWNVRLMGASAAPRMGIRLRAPTWSGFSDHLYPSFNFESGNALIALVANPDTARCERHLY